MTSQIEEVANANNEKSLGSKAFAFVRELVVLVVTAFVLSFIFKTFVFQPFKVDMQSMMPTIEPNYRVLVNKFVYRFSDPKRGDIITFYSNEKLLEEGFNIGDLFAKKNRILIKRVVATEGETIEIKSGRVFINNKPISEKYIKFKDFQSYGPLTVPKDKVFAMGDNRVNSKDSRTFGPVKESEILGKAFIAYWPVDAIKTL